MRRGAGTVVTMRRPTIALSVLGLVACTVPDKQLTSGDAGVDAAPDAPDARGAPFTDVDLLLVVDNSGTMAEEQVQLGIALPAFLNELASSGELPGLHVGVVTSDLGAGPYNISGCDGDGDDGVLQAPASCGVTGRYLSDERLDGERVRNYAGGLGDAVACLAQVGTEGCGFEQHFEAMRRALSGERSDNVGFLRDDALLVVVVVADEDDCSVRDPALFDPGNASLGHLPFRCTSEGVLCEGSAPDQFGTYVGCAPNELSGYLHPMGRYRDFLASLKADPGQVVLITLTGATSPFVVTDDGQGTPTLAPSCSSETGVAIPAVRTAWLSSRVARGSSASICDGVATTMADAALLVRAAIERL